MSEATITSNAGFMWAVADLLRDVYHPSEYGRVILPFTVLRLLDGVLEPTKDKVLETARELPESLENWDPVLELVAGRPFYNVSKHSFRSLLSDPDNVAANLRNYIAGFSDSPRDIIDEFNFDVQISHLAAHNLLYPVMSKFADVDLDSEAVSNSEMGHRFEELIQQFLELSSEAAGEYFTPREVIRLMVFLLFMGDDELLTRPGVVKTMLDPVCGTGGMLSLSEEYLRKLSPQGRLDVFGQELNAETFATCRAYMLIKGQDASRIRFGNSFDNDQHPHRRFDYLLANPPFRVGWEMVAETVRSEHKTKGFAGRFGAGLPRIHDSSFLFLQHMISKMKRPEDGGARLVILFGHSPLSTGAAGSGESEIRRWIIENDWLEAVVALPDQLFYNTGISTYLWVVTNRKSPERTGKVQLIDARELGVGMSKRLGYKQKRISEEHIAAITRLYGAFEEDPFSRIVPNEGFGFLRITVNRPLQLRWEITDKTLTAIASDRRISQLPSQQCDQLIAELRKHRGATYQTEKAADTLTQGTLVSVIGEKPAVLVRAITAALAVRDPDAAVITDRKGYPRPDPTLRNNKEVPLPAKGVIFAADTTARINRTDHKTAINDHLTTEVHPAAWHDPTKTRIGYEIRHFLPNTPPRPLGVPVDGRATVARHRASVIGDLLGSDRESQFLEYKSTLRWDIKQQQQSGVMEDAAIKTIAGFANSFSGGTLLIGVADDGSIHGLEDDYATFSKRGQRGDRDLWSQHLQNLIHKRLGDATFSLVTWVFHKVNGHDVARISIEPSGYPIFDRKGSDEIFWYRIPASTISVNDVKQRNRMIVARWGDLPQERETLDK